MSITVTHAPIRIGVIHGHQCMPTGDLDSLSAIARQMDVDVLISGHTHTYVMACDLQLGGLAHRVPQYSL
jgi:vacuolar protein sorting-associated protein 29